MIAMSSASAPRPRTACFASTASIYYLDWDDILILSSATVNGTPVGVNANGRRARSNGAELTATLRPMRGLSVVANAAYVDAELRDDTVPPGGGLNLTGGLAGDQPALHARISAANLSVDYEWAHRRRRRGVRRRQCPRWSATRAAGFSDAYRAAFGRPHPDRRL